MDRWHGNRFLDNATQPINGGSGRRLPSNWRNPAAEEPAEIGSPQVQAPRIPFHLQPFAESNISSEDIKVQEIGYFSVHGDLEGDETELDFQHNRGLLRTLAFPCDPRSPQPVEFNLDEGFDGTDFRGMMYRREVPRMMNWIVANVAHPEISRVWLTTKIITRIQVLRDLLKIPYRQDLKNATEWIFGAAKVGDKVYLGTIEHQRSQDAVCRTSGGSTYPPTYPSMRNTDTKKYRGLRFQEFMTGTESTSSLTGQVCDPRFRSVVHVNFRGIEIILEAGRDAADPYNSCEYPQKYVDVAIAPEAYMSERRTLTLYKERLFRWWASNVFSGVEILPIGIHEKGLVTQIKTYRTSEIPGLITAKEVELQQHLWNPEVTLGYLHALLGSVLRNVERDYKDVVYEFCRAIAGDEEFQCKTIPADAAVGHTYLPDPEAAVFLENN